VVVIFFFRIGHCTGDSEMEPISSFVLPRQIDRWGLLRSTVKNHDSFKKKRSRCGEEGKKSCKAKQDSGKMKQEKCVSATEKEINLFLIGFTF
jgi:hypothetical protein